FSIKNLLFLDIEYYHYSMESYHDIQFVTDLQRGVLTNFYNCISESYYRYTNSFITYQSKLGKYEVKIEFTGMRHFRH
ncbi:MAG TPA: hypothetical protein PK699_07775, partial [bacterium]|nr:hypothetical protein [bacterium]